MPRGTCKCEPYLPAFDLCWHGSDIARCLVLKKWISQRGNAFSEWERTHLETCFPTHLYTHLYAHLYTHLFAHLKRIQHKMCTQICTNICTHIHTYIPMLMQSLRKWNSFYRIVVSFRQPRVSVLESAVRRNCCCLSVHAL
jgi:hypothetical protein